MAKISEEGVRFQSPYDGRKIELTPERSIEIQNNLGSDIVMIFDDFTSYPATYEDAKISMELSLRWAKRSKDAHQSKSALFGIVQGGMYNDLRTQSLESLMDLDFDGMAVGGLSVGETHEERVTILEHLAPQLPKTLPHYLMGVGKPEDIVEAVYYGIDSLIACSQLAMQETAN